jgi:hypothetical protein
MVYNRVVNTNGFQLTLLTGYVMIPVHPERSLTWASEN